MKYLRIALGVFLALLLTCVADARFPHGNPTGPLVFTHVQIGGAGATMGVASVPSANLLLNHNDQYGCYMSVGGAAWVQLLTYNRMPAGSVTFSSSDLGPIGAGCDTIAGDTLNPANIWMGWNGKVYVSTNSGASFSLSCYPAVSVATSQVNSQATKTLDPTIAVDPNNSNIVYMSTPLGSLQVTRNQGGNCAAASGTLATPTALQSGGGGYLIAFDTSGGTLTGASCPSSVTPCTKNIYVSVYGTGVYKSVDAGASWTLTTSTPTTHRMMKMGGNTGVLWFVDDTYPNLGTGGNAKKFDGTTWTTPSFANSSQTATVAVDQNACASAGTCHVLFSEIGPPAHQAFTTDGGATAWVKSTSVTVASADVAWIAANQNTLGWQAGGGAAFDASGRVNLGGEGVFRYTPLTSAGALTVNSFTAGIEEYENNMVVTSPNTTGQIIVSGWDLGCFVLTAPYNTFPSVAGQCTQTLPTPDFWHSYSIDWVAGAPSTFVVLADNQSRGAYTGNAATGYWPLSAISTDKGATWTNIPAPATIKSSGLIAGCMAASTSTNFVWEGTDGSGGSVAPFYTTNGGTSWTQITVAGVTGGWTQNASGSGGSKSCTTDRVTANTFYFYNWNTGAGFDAIIKCTASGATCTVGATAISTEGNRQFNPTIKAVPGQADTLFLAVGPVTLGDKGSISGFYYSTNGGTTVSTIANMTTVAAFGFGANAPGHTFPTIVLAGYYNGVYGVWQSIDWDGAKTWQKLGTFMTAKNGDTIPMNIWDIDGDKVIPNVFYYGTNSGVFCSATSTAYCNGGT